MALFFFLSGLIVSRDWSAANILLPISILPRDLDTCQWCHPSLWPILLVMISVDDIIESRITWEIGLWVCLGSRYSYRDCIEVGRPAYCGWSHPLAGILGCLSWTKEAEHNCLSFFSLWLFYDQVPLLPWLPTMMDYNLQLRAKIEPFSLKLLWPGYFVTATEETKATPKPFYETLMFLFSFGTGWRDLAKPSSPSATSLYSF